MDRIKEYISNRDVRGGARMERAGRECLDRDGEDLCCGHISLGNVPRGNEASGI